MSDTASHKTWLVFKSGTDSYAIESSAIQEIIRNSKIFPIPFVPPYITGVLNYYGNPYAVLDFAHYLSGDTQNSEQHDTAQQSRNSLFLILNNVNNVALKITDILEFHAKEDISEVSLSNQSETQNFTGAIAFNDTTAPIINLEGILEKVQVDLETK
ncbi:MAG: chemotaxis protein CheW [Treponema sp.]|nr:chemotaxis protein CheW [Treponema sp.]